MNPRWGIHGERCRAGVYVRNPPNLAVRVPSAGFAALTRERQLSGEAQHRLNNADWRFAAIARFRVANPRPSVMHKKLTAAAASVPSVCLSIPGPDAPIKLVAFARFRLFLINLVDPSASA
jgi:hypothetical protein